MSWADTFSARLSFMMISNTWVLTVQKPKSFFVILGISGEEMKRVPRVCMSTAQLTILSELYAENVISFTPVGF